MSQQPGFSFDAPLADVLTTGPVGQTLPPHQGTTLLSAHASYTGAVYAAETRSANISALRQLWREPRTINEIAGIMQLPIASICSLKAGLDLVAVDHEVVEWGDGRRSTKRTRWRLR